MLRCGGILNNCVIARCPEGVAMKEFLKSVNIWQRHGIVFMAHGVCTISKFYSTFTYLLPSSIGCVVQQDVGLYGIITCTQLDQDVVDLFMAFRIFCGLVASCQTCCGFVVQLVV